MLDRQLEIADSTAGAWGETVETMQAMMDAGMANQASVSQMQGTYYAILAQVEDIKDNINQVQNGVNLTLRLLLRSPFVVFCAMIMAFTIDFQAALVFAGVIISQLPTKKQTV